MLPEEKLRELLARWQELLHAGQNIAAEDLCAEQGVDATPELIAELERHMNEVGIMDHLVTEHDLGTDTLERGDSIKESWEGVPTAPTGDEVIFSVGQYDYFRFLAKGGVGEVYRADDKEFGRDVALKFINQDQQQDEESKNQFIVEGEVTAKLEHPGVVPIYGFGYTSDGRPFHVMRLIRGETLGDQIEAFHQAVRHGLDPAERRVRFRKLLSQLVSVSNTVAYAHNRGILHRDIKPDNIMIGKYGETLVVDWGLAKTVERDERARASGEQTLTPGSGDTDKGSLSQGVVGTPSYMSPEQAHGEPDLTPSTDIYGLGATLYKLLTGETAIQGTHLADILHKVKIGKFTPPHEKNHHVPRSLDAVCCKAMALDKADRYDTALELAADIENYLADEKVVAYKEPFTRRVARWSRRNRAAAQSMLFALVALVIVMIGAAVFLAGMAGREKEAHNAATASRDKEIATRKEAQERYAYFAAKSVASQLEYLREVLLESASDPELQRLMSQLQEETGTNVQREVQLWATERFEEKGSYAEPANWFILDANGKQIVRVPEAESIGGNYAWRSYFHGGLKDLPSDTTQEPLQSKICLGAVYRSQPYLDYKVPLSAPIKNADGEVIGVFGLAIDLGQYPVLKQADVMLVNLRIDFLEDETKKRGLILHHPLLRDKLPKVDSQAALPRITSIDILHELDRAGNETGVLDDFRDPLGTYRGTQTVAYASVQLSEVWPTSLRQPKWFVIALEKGPNGDDAER